MNEEYRRVRTSDKLHRRAVTYAKFLFAQPDIRSGEEMASVFIVVWGQPLCRVRLIPGPWESEEQKYILCEALKKFFREHPPERYSMITECWVASVKADDADMIRVPAGQHVNKVDGLSILTVERGSSKVRQTLFEVYTNAVNQRILLPFENEPPDDGGVHAGYMVTLMGDRDEEGTLL